ncbi:MAG: heme-binding domain-containing protein [Candidatus Eisenbacteria bacterium]
MSPSRRLLLGLAIPAALLAAIQLVPYGRDHSAPADGASPVWDSPRTQQLAERACNDCHSNRTRWPWYSVLAPVSWRLQSHVQEGRAKLNFSAFDPRQEEVAEAASEAGETVTKKEMPPFDYLLAHPEARLSPEERRVLAAGLDATFAGYAREGARGGSDSLRMGADGEQNGESDAEENEEHGRGRGRGRR